MHFLLKNTLQNGIMILSKGGDIMAERKKFQGNENSGRKPYQSMKPYLIYKYLLQESDEDNIKKATHIADQLKEEYGISTTPRAVFKDVEIMNQALLITNEKANNVDEAIEMCLKEKNHTIVYDTNRRGFYIPKRREKINDLYTIVDCIYAAPFLDKDTAARLADIVCGEFVSEDEKKRIIESTYVPDRSVSDCTSLLKNLELIRIALAKTVDGKPHYPDRIKFEYMEYQFIDAINRTERSRKRVFTVAPYKIFIHQNRHYLFCCDISTNENISFQIERMRNIKLVPQNHYITQYTPAIISFPDSIMKYRWRKFGNEGHKWQVTLQFEKSLIDTIVDTFGVLDAIYAKKDNDLYTVTTRVDINSRFYGWLCGFNGAVKIIDPPELYYKYLTYLRDHIKKAHR